MRLPSSSILLLIPLSLACSDDFLSEDGGSGDEVSKVLAMPRSPIAGEVAFERHCQVCHDPDGLVDKAGPALDRIFDRATETEIVTLILDGGAVMPPIDAYDQEVADIMGFMQVQFGDGMNAPTPDGSAVFDSKCVACHPKDGSAGIGASLTLVVPGKTVGAIEKVVREGTGTMDPVSGMTAMEITAVSTWVVDTFGGN